MARSAEALINPQLLVWARKSAGLTLEEAAKRAGVSGDRLLSWEEGQKRPTINQLRKLGQAYKRPIAVFYLPQPPLDFQPLRDYRHLAAIPHEPESPELLLEVRRAWSRREIAIELYQGLGEKPPRWPISASTADDPEHVARKIRTQLDISVDVQRGFGSEYNALKWWRSALEQHGILVFQAVGVEVSEMRGFSLTERPLPVIVVNIRDSPLARVFSVLHELVHVALRQGGICDLDDDQQRSPREQEVEVFCNKVAGAVLVPREELFSEALVREHGPQATTWSDNEIAFLARRFWVSHEVILRRLLICDLTTKAFYQEKRSELAARRKPRGEGFPPPAQMAISTTGHTFIRLVLDNYYRENITSSQVADFLNVNLKHLREIERKVMGQNVVFGEVA
jgi:Zn-dependent peptidase ImmA (M78 family)/DNA-binding XRE family transcriptional regulator